MDQRLYFIIGDILAAALTGILVGLACVMLVSPNWNMFIAMVVFMAVGMVIGMLVFFPLSISFGAMEIMMPCMLSGMVSGMAVSMWAAMQPLSLGGASFLGLQSGLCALLFIWVANTLLRSKNFS